MKYINKIGMMVVAGSMLAATSCSDFDDYNSAPDVSAMNANNTLWQNITSSPDLSDFASVLKAADYDKILDAAHTYTVWAPVNGSFDANRVLAMDKDRIIREFIKNHVADFNHLESNYSDTTIYMLNAKLLPFANKGTENTTFDGQKVLGNSSLAGSQTIYNHPSKNGTLYTIAGPSTFRYNGYEYIFEQGGVADAFMEFVKKYETRTLDTQKSVKGEIKDGRQEYDDSVMIVSNSLTSSTLRAKVDSEDSLYTVLIPTDQAWTQSYDSIKKYFKYISPMNYQDLSHKDVGNTKGGTTSSSKATISLIAQGSTQTTLSEAPADSEFGTTAYWTDSITKRNITQNLIFSNTNKHYNSKLTTGEAFVKGDSLYSTTRNLLTNAEKLNQYIGSETRLSNGKAILINELPWKASETFCHEIETSQVARDVTAPGSSSSTYYIRKENLDPAMCKLPKDMEALYYIRTDLPANSTFAPELDFYLPGILSTTYDFYIVMLPACIEDPTCQRKPYDLRVDLNYTNEKNELVAGRFDGQGLVMSTESAKLGKVEILPCDTNKVDTVYLGRVTFPVCYRGTDAKPNIKVMHTSSTFSATNLRKYEQIFRIHSIIARPVDVLDEIKEATKED